MKKLFTVSDEFNIFKIYELDNEYRGILTNYYLGKVSSKYFYSYPKTNIPEDLLKVLIEANPSNLDYLYQVMLWNLVDEKYKL